MSKYQIFTDSCSDLSKELRAKNNIELVYMGLVVDGVEKRADLNWEDYSVEEFYGWLQKGCKVKTTQVSILEFTNRFRPYLEKGIDIIYLACSSALTASLNACQLASEELLKEFPDRKIIGYDTLTSSCTLGILVLDAAKEQQKGASLEELVKWCDDNKFNYNQFATVETLTFLKNAGRIKGSKAFMGNLIGVKPIFISDRKGNNFTVMTVKGTKNADRELIEGIRRTIGKDVKKIVIGQGMAQERALRLKKTIEDELKVEAEIWWIGPIVGTTCGPGVVATFCYGKEVTRFEGDGIAQGY